MSCTRTQRQAAAAAASTAVSQTGSQSAGMAGQSGQAGVVALKPGGRKSRQRTVRPAVKKYRQLPLSKKEQLWTALAKATLQDDEAQQRRRLKAAVREFGAGVVAAAVAEEVSRFQRERDDWSLRRYRQIREQLGEVQAEVKAETKAEAKAKAETKEKEKDRMAITPAKSGRGRDGSGENGRKKTSPARIKVTGLFSRSELDQLRVRTLLGGAAANRQLQALNSGAARGIEFGDPRVEDWLAQDRHNFRFLSRQLAQVARDKTEDALEIAQLTEAELVDLWEFSRFEADRALRNIDHLQSGWSHLKGETADYMTRNYTLEARFFTHLAAQLEPRLTPEMRAKYGVSEV